MKKKPKYDWSQPSLCPENDLHPANKELREIRTGIDKNGRVFRNAVITKTKAAFVEQARKIWGERYEYTDSVYVHGKKPITIYCPKHDYHFRVAMAQNHIMPPRKRFKPTGCPICSAEKLHGCEYGTDWQKYLKLCAKNSRVCKIGYCRLDPEEKDRRKTERKAKADAARAEREAEREAKAAARLREEQAYIARWKAKNLKEARFLERLQNRYPNMYDTHLVNYKDKDNRVTLICPTHGEFRIKPLYLFGDRRHKAHGCWRCAGMIPPDDRPSPMTAEKFFQRMHELYDATELDFMTSEFKGAHKNVTAYCRRHGVVTHSASYWLEGNGCEYCNGKFYPPDFLKMARKAQGQEYSYRGVKNITSASSRVMVHCSNPNHKWHRMIVWLILQGCKCRECAGRHQSLEERREKFLNKFYKKHGKSHYRLTADDYLNNDTPIKVHCLVHHYDFKTAPDNLLRGGGGCPYCTASEGEATILGWLDNHNIHYIWHEPIPNEDPTLLLQYVETDFWLPDYNLYIEYHGQQHYEEIPYFHEGKKVRTFAVQQRRDRYLRKYCRDHKIRLIEIPYTDFNRIDEILTEALLDNQD